MLADLTKGEEYIDLVKEYNCGETKEAKFAKQCDKLEATFAGCFTIPTRYF